MEVENTGTVDHIRNKIIAKLINDYAFAIHVSRLINTQLNVYSQPLVIQHRPIPITDPKFDSLSTDIDNRLIRLYSEIRDILADDYKISIPIFSERTNIGIYNLFTFLSSVDVVLIDDDTYMEILQDDIPLTGYTYQTIDRGFVKYGTPDGKPGFRTKDGLYELMVTYVNVCRAYMNGVCSMDTPVNGDRVIYETTYYLLRTVHARVVSQFISVFNVPEKDLSITQFEINEDGANERSAVYNNFIYNAHALASAIHFEILSTLDSAKLNVGRMIKCYENITLSIASDFEIRDTDELSELFGCIPSNDILNDIRQGYTMLKIMTI